MTTNNSEKIIEKIKKVLELSRNNPSQEEAKSAALMAQKLMAEYHISIAEVEAIEKDIDKIAEEYCNTGTGNKWKYTLASVISNNFRCKHFIYGREAIVFYGYETDAKIAAETFKYLFTVGNKGANAFYMNKRNEKLRNDYYSSFKGKGIKNNYLMGFVDGIKSELEKQCTALMIVTPKEVKDSFEEKVKGWGTISSRINLSSRYADEARQEGLRKGRDAIGSRKLAMN